jgi:DNA ligase 1
MKMLLAHTWEGSDPTGWLISEKLDGHRAYWTGNKLITRSGNIITPPPSFTENFPNESLDGELWAGRDNRDRVTSIVASDRESDWEDCLYVIFDSPDCEGGFEHRISHARNITDVCSNTLVLPQTVCFGRSHLLEKLDEIISEGGEGIMLRKPGSLYERCRSYSCLKVKKERDDEAEVIGYKEGKNGNVGSLIVRRADSLEFKVSGLSEYLKDNPPAIGSIISYTYKNVTKSGKPAPASFWRIRKDI